LRALALALAAVWVVTLAFADTAVTPEMHCQGGHMPCCPRTGNGESCAGTRCVEQVPEKAEARVAQAGEGETQKTVLWARMDGASRFALEPVRELTQGLSYRASVFYLKDDLRI
jgi:hypothetical protein